MTGSLYLEAFIPDYMENEWGLPLGVLLRGAQRPLRTAFHASSTLFFACSC
jgi:hypothetical protein